MIGHTGRKPRPGTLAGALMMAGALGVDDVPPEVLEDALSPPDDEPESEYARIRLKKHGKAHLHPPGEHRTLCGRRWIRGDGKPAGGRRTCVPCNRVARGAPPRVHKTKGRRPTDERSRRAQRRHDRRERDRRNRIGGSERTQDTDTGKRHEHRRQEKKRGGFGQWLRGLVPKSLLPRSGHR